MLLSCNRIRKQYDGIEILKGIDLDIAFGERIGLVGPNGAGKTTLMQAIAHEVSIDDGDITFWLPRTKIGYLRQSVGASRFSEGYRLITVTRRLESGKTIVEPPAADTDELRELLKISSQLGIGYLDEWSAQHINGLSGGERAKLALARIWSAQPDLLLLDEPTNHMDLNGIDWLIDQLRQYTGAVLVISHDRYFLDQVVCRIVEIDDGKAESYSGNYSFYREERARIRAAQLRQYEEAKRQEKRLEEDVLRTKQWAAKAHREAGKKSEIRSAKVGDRARAKRIDRQAKAKVKRLERHRARAPRKPKDDPNIRFQIKSAEKHGRRMIYAKGISKEYSGRALFRDSSFYILRGDKVGLLGKNGCGKTTLLKIILGEETPDEGEVWISPSACIGYLAQGDPLSGADGSTLDVLGLSSSVLASKARTLLAQMGIGEDLVHKPVSVLSAGERTKVEIARLIINQANLLLLDEPTNHLDIYAREQLEAALVAYDGTIIMASHDRRMLESVCNRILVFEDGQIRPMREEADPPDVDVEWCFSSDDIELDLP